MISRMGGVYDIMHGGLCRAGEPPTNPLVSANKSVVNGEDRAFVDEVDGSACLSALIPWP